MKAFILVGHEDWGKSMTIKSLIKPKTRGFVSIANKLFFVRRMSNDDKPESLRNFITKLKNKPLLVMTLCPNFDNLKRYTIEILNKLKSKDYELYFEVIKKQQKRGKNGKINNKEITTEEINKLKKYDSVNILNDYEEPDVRASKFLKFIKNNLK